MQYVKCSKTQQSMITSIIDHNTDNEIGPVASYK